MANDSLKGRAAALWAGCVLVGALIGVAPSCASAVRQAPERSAMLASISLFADQYAILAPSTTKQPRISEPFRATYEATNDTSFNAKWAGVQHGLHRDSSVLQRCRADLSACPAAPRAFLAILDRAQSRAGWSRIAEVNRSINLSIRASADKEQYGVRDFWATPLLTFTSRAGDCEDLAIAKYAALRELGYADNDLRLVIADDKTSREVHAVLGVRHEGRWLILDNKTLEIKDDMSLSTLDPLFVISGDGVRKITALLPTPMDTPWTQANVQPVLVYALAAWPMMAPAL